MKKVVLSILTILTLFIVFTETSSAKDKPNILVIWGDDVGMTNISAYSRGLMIKCGCPGSYRLLPAGS